ncbi:MAG: type VI secretion system ImpA family N-terminal domain-containing protein [Rubrivivax sp.]|nr:type VI secretion system ImpA family N-terminal domain-containing protein [Rubrivivax sp.]
MKPEDLLQPISSDAPAGIECVYDNEFQMITELSDYLVLRAEIEELRRTATGQFEGENAPSDRTMAELARKAAEDRSKMQALRVKEILGKEAEPARVAAAIETRCISLLKSTGKDLRVVQPLTMATLKLRGLPGLLEGLAVFEGLLSSFADTVHPLPEEDDPGDDTSRTMVLGELLNHGGGVAMLRETVLANSRAGRLSFRDAEVLDGVQAPDPSGQSLSSLEHLLAVVRGQMAEASDQSADLIRDSDLRERLRILHLELVAAEDTLRRIAGSFRRKTRGEGRLTQLLGRMAAMIGQRVDELDAGSGQGGVSRFLSDVPAAPAAAKPADAGPTPATPRPQPAAVAQPVQPALVTREDARRQILELAAFLEKLEPSHPAPLFLRRAARLLAAKSFFDIVGDMIPDVTHQVETLTGQKVPERPEAAR